MASKTGNFPSKFGNFTSRLRIFSVNQVIFSVNLVNEEKGNAIELKTNIASGTKNR